jgi:hypothetical protein
MINQENTIYKKIDLKNTSEINSKITKVKQIIDLLFDAQIKLADENLGVQEYRIDTGQSIHHVKRDSIAGVANLIEQYEKMLVYYNNKKLSRVTKLIDGSNLKHRNG